MTDILDDIASDACEGESCEGPDKGADEDIT